MTKPGSDPTRNYWLMAPALGSLLYIVLYIVATRYYPGGSQADKTSRGFDWVNNYWCNLMNEKGVNGEVNPGRPVALTALGVLCVSMASFAWLFPRQAYLNKVVCFLLQCCGIGSMAVTIFLFTEWHDGVIDVAGILGMVGVIGTLVGLWRMKWKVLFWVGILNVVLVVLNYLMYNYPPWIPGLPLVQKITFLGFLCWISLISVRFFLQGENRENRR